MVENKTLLKLQWGIIFAFVIFIALLIHQNIQLKSHPIIQKATPQKSQSCLFEEKMASELLYKRYPLPLNMEEFYFQAEFPMPTTRYYLVMLFDFTVCGHCLNSGLSILKLYKEKLEDKGIRVLGVIGTVGKGEESEIISMKNNEAIFFPCQILPVDGLYKTFGLKRERFLDTPFFLLVSYEGQVLDIFKPEYLETTELTKWIEILSRMDML